MIISNYGEYGCHGEPPDYRRSSSKIGPPPRLSGSPPTFTRSLIGALLNDFIDAYSLPFRQPASLRASRASHFPAPIIDFIMKFHAPELPE